METVSAGRPLVELITLAYRANQPVLLHGQHGIGKSELLAQAADRLAIGFIVRDLSLMEPPDLSGIPRILDGRTHYAAPSFLPTEGRGLLVIEELNRCPRYMQAPTLQLLTARRLNDYVLPEGWLPCAAINDASDGYQTDELDAALLSRFLQVRVVPDVGEWIGWAIENGIHEKIIEFVSDSPDVFSITASNPRAWSYASKILSTWEDSGGDEKLLAAALAGVLDDRWAQAFIIAYRRVRRPLQPQQIIECYPAHQASVRRWAGEGRLDVIRATIDLLKRFIQPQPVYDSVIGSSAQQTNIEKFIRDLPADLREEFAEWLVERGFVKLAGSARCGR